MANTQAAKPAAKAAVHKPAAKPDWAAKSEVDLTVEKDPADTTELPAHGDDADAPVVPAAVDGDKHTPEIRHNSAIKYTGTADVRRMTRADLTRLGVDSPKADLEWSPKNNFQVSVHDMNGQTFQILLKQPGFTAV